MTINRKKLISFFILSLVEYLLMIGIVLVYYKGIRRNITLPLFTLILLQPIIYKKLYSKRKYIVAIKIFLIILFFILLPPYTYNQAKEIVNDAYKYEIEVVTNGDRPYYKNTVPVVENSGILGVDKFYYFSLRYKVNGEKIYLMVNPMNGDIIKLKEKYWTY